MILGVDGKHYIHYQVALPGGTNSQTGYTVRVFHYGLSTENIKQSQNASIHKTGGLFI